MWNSNHHREQSILPKTRHSQGGAALLLVVWVVALLTLLAATALQIASTSARTAEAALQRTELAAVADGAINLALLQMIDPDSMAPWPVDGSFRTLNLAAYAVDVTTIDEAGKADINTASLPVLSASFNSAGVSAADADIWAAAIAHHRNSGRADGSHAFAHGFRTVGEISSVIAINQLKLNCLRPDLTVYTGLEGIDLRYARPDLKRALITAVNSPPASTNSGGIAEPDYAGPSAGRVFGLTATISGQKAKIARYAVVRLTGDPRRAVLSALWHTAIDDASEAHCDSEATAFRN